RRELGLSRLDVRAGRPVAGAPDVRADGGPAEDPGPGLLLGLLDELVQGLVEHLVGDLLEPRAGVALPRPAVGGGVPLQEPHGAPPPRGGRSRGLGRGSRRTPPATRRHVSYARRRGPDATAGEARTQLPGPSPPRKALGGSRD